MIWPISFHPDRQIQIGTNETNHGLLIELTSKSRSVTKKLTFAREEFRKIPIANIYNKITENTPFPFNYIENGPPKTTHKHLDGVYEFKTVPHRLFRIEIYTYRRHIVTCIYEYELIAEKWELINDLELMNDELIKFEEICEQF